MPFYDVYETADGRHLAVGSLEPKFYDELVRLLGIADTAPDRNDPAHHPELRRVIGDAVAARTQAEWVEVFDGSDACVAPVLPMSEAFDAPPPGRARHLRRARRDHPARAGAALLAHRAHAHHSATRASPARTPATALAAWGIDDVDALLASGAAVQAMSR